VRGEVRRYDRIVKEVRMSTTPPSTRPFRFTREQYYRLGELGFFYGKRVERIRGEIREMSPIGWPHIVGCRKTAELLGRAFAGLGWVYQAAPLALTDSDPEPDVAIIPGRFEDYATHPTGALLVVEVADATIDYDTTTKAELYAEAGIAEYWVLDVNARQLHVFRDPTPLPSDLGATAYATRLTLTPTDAVSPLAAPGATITVGDLLP
jgi:Uma2 family endonuclease